VKRSEHKEILSTLTPDMNAVAEALNIPRDEMVDCNGSHMVPGVACYNRPAFMITPQGDTDGTQYACASHAGMVLEDMGTHGTYSVQPYTGR
jgi:hypothetical protein